MPETEVLSNSAQSFEFESRGRERNINKALELRQYLARKKPSTILNYFKLCIKVKTKECLEIIYDFIEKKDINSLLFEFNDSVDFDISELLDDNYLTKTVNKYTSTN